MQNPKDILLRLWNSPTFTTWGNQGAQALRLLAVTPLILTTFNQTEIAAWYLFSSVSFLGVILAARIGQTFSRMIAFAMSGSDDLSPIKGDVKNRLNNSPNWKLVESCYATTGSINALLVVLILLSTLFMGWFGLSGLLDEYAEPNRIWAGFIVIMISQAILFLFQQYAVALKGMNYVAMVNRWNVIFSLLSVIGGVLTLRLGGGIFELACVMQSVLLLNILRNWWLLKHVENGVFKEFKGFGFNKQVLKWAWEPTWKGFIVQFANTGLISISAIIIARSLSVADAAAILFTISIAQSMRNVANAPFISHGPKMSRLLAAGRLRELKKIVFQKINHSQALLGLGGIFIVLFGSKLLVLINSNTLFIDHFPLVLFFMLYLAHNQFFLLMQISGIGNNMICVGRSLMALIVSLISVGIFASNENTVGIIVSLYIYKIMILGLAPSNIASKTLKCSLIFTVAKLNISFFLIILLFGFLIWI